MKTRLNRIFTYLMAVAITGSALIGCQKYINLEPKNSTYDGVFWVNGANVQKALSGAYSMLRNAFRQDRSYFIFGDVAANNFVLGGDFWNYNTFVESGNFRFGYAPYLEGSVWNWSRFYGIINQCHLIVENTAAIDVSKFSGGEAQQRQLEGEARFLRAFTYFYMQRVWGDVVLTKESFRDPQNIPIIPRIPEEETLAFCIEDLEKSIALLDNASDKALAGKGAAQALLAHIYAWKHDYQQAESYANDVINGPYALEDIENYVDIWKGNSQESIFELNMLFDAVSNEATSGFFNIFLTDPFIRNKSAASSWTIGQEVSQLLFDEDEARFDTITTPGASSTLLLNKYRGVDYYDANNPNTYVVSNNLVLYRLADIYLLRAEARFKNGNETGALGDLNVIRQRAKLADFAGSGDALFNEIFDERRRELIGEGHTQFDMIRMEQLQRLYPSQYTDERIAKQGYYWPLNMRTLLPQNPELTQNEWWSSN
ncbi:RagB/SusD family nutrient uptake outer membrane protein [Parapedobacter sp. 2B3]|uniref:RagB/SusD family nutrient uptake outer membrane protein n=1 Tax=Parapedobacter sp. 2B3 TaxID=3342381 RepID=UPI0035B5CAD9